MTIETQSAVAEVVKPTAVQGEPDMVEYARMRAAGEKIVVKPAAVTDESKTAVATDATAAAAESKKTDDQTAEASATTEEVEPDVEDAHPAKQSINKKFAKLTNSAKEAKAEAEQAKVEAAAAKAEVESLKAAAAEAALAAIPVVKPAAEDPKPSRTDFDDPDEYAEAISAHAARSVIRESAQAAQAAADQRAAEVRREQETAQQAHQQTQIEELHKTFNARLEKAKSELPDFEEKVFAETAPSLDHGVFFAVEKSEVGPQILYHLAKNPAEAENLNKLNRTDPMQALIRLGELQAEIRLASKPKPSKAAEPIKPVGNRASPERKTPDEMDMDEYNAHYQQRIQAARGRR